MYYCFSKLKNELWNIMKKMFHTGHELGLVEESARVDSFSIYIPKKKKTSKSTITYYTTIGYSFNFERPTYRDPPTPKMNTYLYIVVEPKRWKIVEKTLCDILSK